MIHFKTKLLFRLFHYLTLCVIVFNFILYPAYSMVEHFPYGVRSKIYFPFIRPDVFTSNNFINNDNSQQNKDYIIEESITNKVSKKKEITKSVVSSLEYYAIEKSGTIGYSSEKNFDDPYDNIFTIKIDKTELRGKDILLSYDVYGIENNSGISRSINNNPMVGGIVVKKNTEWRNVQENISENQLVDGINHIMFNSFLGSNVNYSIKNLKVIVTPKTNQSLLKIIDGNYLFIKDNKAYLRGVISHENAELRIENKLVHLKNNEFEILLDDASKLNNLKYEIFSLSGKLLENGNLPIYDKVEVNQSNFLQNTYQSKRISSTVENSFKFDTDEYFFEITTDNYDRASDISVQKLRNIDLAPLGTNVINVTSNKEGFRFLPDGAKFKEETKIGVKYDSTYLPKGYTPNDVKILYFDMEQRRWLSIPTDTILLDQQKIIAKTTHFTDYIAGVIQAPESPETNSFSPTSISDIQVANPTANIVQIQPPTANQQGDGTVDFPITLPSSRSGLDPSLSVSYNNNGSSGLAGEGWDIQIPTITVDTKFGVPKYDATYETESYLLNGQEIMLSQSFWSGSDGYLPHRTSNLVNRIPDASFKPKVESSFSRIQRMGSSPTNYSWVVTDKSGTKYTYAQPLKDRVVGNVGNIAKWYLSLVEDKNGNKIKYTYSNKEMPTTGIFKDGNEVYLEMIEYNSHTSYPPNYNDFDSRSYTVIFNYVPGNRIDSKVNYRYGFKENTTLLLSKIHVGCTNFVDRGGIPDPYNRRPNWNAGILPCDTDIEYQFHYNTQGAFGKVLLDKITTINKKIDVSTALVSESESYEHKFEYYNDIAGGMFKTPQSIYVDKDFSGDKHAILSSSVENFNSSDYGFSAGVSLSSNPHVWWPFSNSGTINVSFPSPSATTSSPTMLLMDIDGDGLDDKVMKIGNLIKYRKNLAGIAFSKQLYSVNNITDLGLSESNSKTDPELSFSLMFLNLTSSKSQSNSRSRNYFTDVNNDGLVDYIKDKIVYFNRMDSGSGIPTFTSDSNLTPNVIIKEGNVDASVSQGLPNISVGSELMDVVKVWVAPRDGSINISGNISKAFVASHNGVRFSVEHASTNSSSYLINPTLLVNATLSTNVINTQVTAGDHIYFRVNSSQLPDGEVSVDWNPRVSYSTGNLESSSYSEAMLFGDVEGEPLMINKGGQYRLEWSFANLNLSSAIQLTTKVYTINTGSSSSSKNYITNFTQNITSSLPSYSFNIPASNVSLANPNSYIYIEIEAVGSSGINWKEFDNGFIPKIRNLIDNSIVHIVPKYNIDNNAISQNLGVGNLYKNWGQFAYKGAAPDQNFTLIKKSLISKALLAGSDNLANPTQTGNMDSQANPVSFNFTTGNFSGGGTTFTLPADQLEAIEKFMMLRSDRANLAWSAHPLLQVKANSMSPNYRTDNSSYTPMVPIPNPTGVGNNGAYAIVKESTSTSQSSNWSASFYGFSLGNGQNKATSTSINDFLDVNGDGYPDVLGERIQLTSRLGGLTNNFIDKSVLSVSNSNGSGKSAGGSSAHVSVLADKNGRFSRIKVGNAATFSGNINVGINKFETTTSPEHILLDINGDGLVDIIKPNGQVELNNTIDFISNVWSGYDNPSVSKTTSASLSGGFGGGFSDFTGVLPSVTANDFVAVSNLDLSAGVSGSRSTTQREKDFIDLNGDGLPDFISGNTVKMNNGTTFSGGTYNLDRLSESTSFSIGTTINASILVPIGPLFGLVIKVGAGGGKSFGKSYNEDNVSLRDFNGDGYPDIVETVSEHEIKVMYSKIGRTNMLKKVINPTGSTIELDYATYNKKTNTSFGSTYKMPFKKWILTNVKVNDGFSSDGVDIQEYAFEYLNGYKDRRERKFLGFGEVKTFQINNAGQIYRTQVQEYLINDMPNSHIYLPGSSSDSRKYQYIASLPKKTSSFDGTNRLINQVVYDYVFFERPIIYLIGQTNNFNTYSAINNIVYNDQKSIIPLLRSTSNTSYIYGQGGGTSNLIVSKFKEYDRYGNVLNFEEQVNGVNTNNVLIGYHELTSGIYNVSTPAFHNVNNYQRYTTTTVDARGNVTQINRHKDFNGVNEISTSDYEYNSFGKLTKVILPKPNINSNASERMFYRFDYDNNFHKNIVRVTDANGYISENTYNHFGLVTKQKDINNVEIFNEYDAILRLTKVKGPYNTDWTIKNEYKKNPNTGLYYAITKHNIKDESVSPGEQILHTSSFADGLGRIIQTKKELDLAQECSGSNGYRLAVSGIQIYDEFGRVVESDLSQEEIDCNGSFNSALENYTPLVRDPLLKTTMIYDMQDRMVQSHVHGLNASTIYEYSVLQDHNGGSRYTEIVTLPEGNVSQTFKDAKGQVILTKQVDYSNNIQLLTKYNYNTIGELLSVIDADGNVTSYQYDTLGQKTQVEHPDNGITKFEYDLAGKLIASSNQNLFNYNQNSKIQYQYNFNQLRSVSYPSFISNGITIPEYTVNYLYGTSGAANYGAGRLIEIQDLTGHKYLQYGKLGEVTREQRILNSQYGSISLTTGYKFDTWGRLLNMTYPDGEIVDYNYNQAGQLTSILNNNGEYYLKNVTYNFFDQPVQIDYGNDVVTYNTYDLMQRIHSMRLDRPDTTTFMNNMYTYDKNQNITNIKNLASQHALLKLGGVSSKNYTYDKFNRLVSASGRWSGGDNEDHNFSVNLTYNNTHGIVSKNQNHQIQTPNFNGLSENTYNGQYEYTNSAHPHAVSSILYSGLRGNQSATATFDYDANGNMLNYSRNYGTDQASFSTREMIWDQQNRLLGVIDDGSNVSHYVYDHAGERTFKSTGAVTQVNIGGAPIHEVLDFNNYLVYPSGYIVVDLNKDEYSKHYYINGKRFVSRIASDANQFTMANAMRTLSNDTESTETKEENTSLDFNEVLGVQNTTYAISIGNNPLDCQQQIDNIMSAYVNLNTSTNGSVQNCLLAIDQIRNEIGNSKTACEALIEINAYVCTPNRTNTPDSTPTPSFTAAELIQFDCLTELNILVGQYTAASEALIQQSRMQLRGGGYKYGCNNAYQDGNCCQRYQQTGVWDCPECPELTLADCGIVPIEEQTPVWQACIKDCLENSNHPGYGTQCWDEFLNTGEWMEDCFYLLVDCEHCKEPIEEPTQEEIDCLYECQIPGVQECINYYNEYGIWTKSCDDLANYCECDPEDPEGPKDPDPEALECMVDCNLEGAIDCVEFFNEYGYWSKFCQDLSVDCECSMSEEDEILRDCALDCPNPKATECYEHYASTGVWLEDCQTVMSDCGCDENNPPQDCYKRALLYIRKNLSFNTNNACDVLSYVKNNFKCNSNEFVHDEGPTYLPDLVLPTPTDGGNYTLPGQDGPYNEDERKPIWWYHTDHLGSSTYLTDNFGRPSHYYETLPFGEMMVEHNQSANNGTNNGYNNAYKFNGKELDDATGMYYYGARYYDPRISIFVSVDPLAEQTMEPYSYVGNNPIMFTDPTGMSAEPPPGTDYEQGHRHTDEEGTQWQLNGRVWENQSGGEDQWQSETLPEMVIEADRATDYVGVAKEIGSYLPGGGAIDIYDGIKNGNNWQVGLGVASLVADAVSFGTGGFLVKGGAKSFLKGGVKEASEQSIKKSTRRLWKLTDEGASVVKQHDQFGKFYKNKNNDLWWSIDKAGHGQSKFKVFKETDKGLEWFKDADEFGDFIINKHKGPTGKSIPWKKLN